MLEFLQKQFTHTCIYSVNTTLNGSKLMNSKIPKAPCFTKA